MTTKVLTKREPVTVTSSPAPVPEGIHDFRLPVHTHETHVRRLKLNVAAWVVGTTVLTTLWVSYEWAAAGAFESFGFDGDPGQWSPTLWALAVGVWSLVVGIMALRVYFERPFSRDTIGGLSESRR